MFGFLPRKDDLEEWVEELNEQYQSFTQKTHYIDKIKVVSDQNFDLLIKAVMTNNVRMFTEITAFLQTNSEGKEKLEQFLTKYQFGLDGMNCGYFIAASSYGYFDMCQQIVNLISDMKLDLREIIKDANYIPLYTLLNYSRHNIILDKIGEDALLYLKETFLEKEQIPNSKSDFIQLIIKNFDTKFLTSFYNQINKELKNPQKFLYIDRQELKLDIILFTCKYDKLDFLKKILEDVDKDLLKDLFSIACKNGSINVVKYLVENHTLKDDGLLEYIMYSKVNNQNSKFFPLHMSIQNGHLDLTQYLISLISTKKILGKDKLKTVLVPDGDYGSISTTLSKNTDGKNGHLNTIVHLIAEDIISPPLAKQLSSPSYAFFLAKLPKFFKKYNKLNKEFSVVPKFKPLVDIALVSKNFLINPNMQGNYSKKVLSKLITPNYEVLLKIFSFISGGEEVDVKQNINFIKNNISNIDSDITSIDPDTTSLLGESNNQ